MRWTFPSPRIRIWWRWIEPLEALARIDAAPEARIVELKFFGGLSSTSAASVLDLPPEATVDRQWAVARQSTAPHRHVRTWAQP